jgi:hypothetical protein
MITTERIQFKGKISITHSGLVGDTMFRICIDDVDAGVQIVEVVIDAINFAEALASIGHRDCMVTATDLNHIGKQIERKHEWVEYPKGYSPSQEDIENALAPYEIDGWMADRYGFSNSKNGRHIDNCRNIMFYRWVEKEE